MDTTLLQIKAAAGLNDGDYRRLRESFSDYGERDTITFRQIYERDGYFSLLRCSRAIPRKYLLRHFACDCAESVAHMLTDTPALEALKASRAYADHPEELKALEDARAAASRWYTLPSIREARTSAAAATWGFIYDAATAAAGAYAAGEDAFGEGARAEAAYAAQARLLLEYLETGERPANSAEKLTQYLKESE